MEKNHIIDIPPCTIIPTQDTKPSLGRRPKDGFVSKWVYKFWPAKNLCTYQDILLLLLLSNITQGEVNSKKCVQNPLVSSRTFFGSQPNFFCPIYSILLMSSKNLSFFSIQTSHRRWSTAKNMCKILQSLAELFLAASRTFFVRSIPSF